MSGWIDELIRTERLPNDFKPAVQEIIGPLAESIHALRTSLARPVVIGINGAQGSGKSTVALFLSGWLEQELGLKTAILSLDDLYLTKAERQTLAQESHPLFVTRGVPGTHDVALGARLLDALTGSVESPAIALPSFDKSLDDRRPEADWQTIEAPVDVVLFEGWCVGARAQDEYELNEPVNALEAEKDPDVSWRRAINDRLTSDYAELFARLDMLVMLRVPSFDQVFEWRRLQEEKLHEATGHGQADAELVDFIRYFERLTRHMLKTTPGYADCVIDIDNDHRLVET
ncbi:MAG: hypothetical protein KJO09_02740 [Gammaproteobacteria bacterium]|nr:hypothetical protein [Gammaproteobacteria bacterium]